MTALSSGSSCTHRLVGAKAAHQGTFSLSPSSSRAPNSATTSRRPCHCDKSTTSATRPAPPAVPCRASCPLLLASLVSPMHLPQFCVRAHSLAVGPAKSGQEISSSFALKIPVLFWEFTHPGLILNKPRDDQRWAIARWAGAGGSTPPTPVVPT